MKREEKTPKVNVREFHGPFHFDLIIEDRKKKKNRKSNGPKKDEGNAVSKMEDCGNGY